MPPVIRAAFVLGVLVAPPLQAQLRGALDVGAGVGRTTAPWMRESRITPSLLFTGASGFLHGNAAVLERGGDWRVLHSSFDAGVSTPTFGPFRLAASARVDHDSLPPRSTLEASPLTASLSATHRSFGAWIGATSHGLRAPGLVAGVWKSLGFGVVSVYSTRRAFPQRNTTYRIEAPGWDTVETPNGPEAIPIGGHTDTITTSRLRDWADIEGRVDWARGRFALSAIVAHRPAADSAPSQLWGRLSATVQLRPSVSLVAGAGAVPAAYGTPQPMSRHYYSLGLRLSPPSRTKEPAPVEVRPAATAFALHAEGEGLHRVTLRVPGARTVELSGDFNGWNAVELRETSAGVWETTLALPVGTHRISIRVNADRWTAPPGIPAVDDEFNGRVGVIVVR